MPKTPAEQEEFLTSLGLNPNAPKLAASLPAEEPATVASAEAVALAPAGADPHTMPVTKIVFDPRLLDGFTDLTGHGMKAASDYVFALYRSPNRDKDRHSLLHSRIGEFIAQTRRARNTLALAPALAVLAASQAAPHTAGHVKDRIVASREQDDLAAVLAAKGVTTADLIGLLTEQ